MIEIKKVTDAFVEERIASRYGVIKKENEHLIAAIDREEVLCYALFSYTGEQGRILSIGGFDGDLSLQDGLCRAIMNIMDIKGVKEVYLSSGMGRLANMIGFKPEDGGFKLNLDGFFCCKKAPPVRVIRTGGFLYYLVPGPAVSMPSPTRFSRLAASSRITRENFSCSCS